MILRAGKLDLILSGLLGLPLAWVLLQLVRSAPQLAWENLLPAIWQLTLRTVVYDLLATIAAFFLALPAIWVLSKASPRALVFALGLIMCALVQPPVNYLYGWSQFLRLSGIFIDPQSPADVLRCIWTLSTWLWPIPAAAVGLALRSLDRDTLDAARLDGGQRRIVVRQLLMPVAGAAAVTFALSLQQFTVFEQTNIAVVATEARTVFSIGSIGGLNLIHGGGDPGQTERIAAAAAVCLPIVLGIFVLIACARQLLAGHWIVLGLNTDLPRQRTITWPVSMVALITMGIPLVSMRLALAKPPHWGNAIIELLPQLTGSLMVSGLVAVMCLAVGSAACAFSLRWTFRISIVAFLAGGQMLALGVIHLLNRPLLDWAYDSPAGVIMVHVAMFAWISILPARQLAGDAWRELRLAASADGAGAWQYLLRIALPASWRWHVAATLVVFCLSFGEIPAVMLLQPQRPQMLMPMLMTWVHLLRYDAMIEGALLLALVVLTCTIVGVLLMGSRRFSVAHMAVLIPLLILSSCDGVGDKPDEIWQPPAIRPLIYPRGIAYSKVADEFFVIDRVARMQRISADGKFISEWQMPQQENGRPVGISIGPDGNVYVPDTHYYRVMVYSPSGEFLRQFGRRGSGPGEFLYVTDVAFDQNGNVFVSEYGDNDRVQVFSPDGSFLYQFGRFGTGDGEFARPQSMVIDGGTIYITDAGNHRIVVFTTAGKFLRAMGSTGSGPGQYRFPYGLDQDRDGNLIVTEFGNNRVQKIDKDTGVSLGMWGRSGRREGELAYPWAAVVDRRGRVVIVDSGNNRLQLTHFR